MKFVCVFVFFRVHYTDFIWIWNHKTAFYDESYMIFQIELKRKKRITAEFDRIEFTTMDMHHMCARLKCIEWNVGEIQYDRLKKDSKNAKIQKQKNKLPFWKVA